MFTWSLIILAIALSFGVVKIEQIKDVAKKYEPKARELFNKAKTVVEQKIAEAKKNNEAKKAASTPTTTKNKAEKKEENSESEEK